MEKTRKKKSVRSIFVREKKNRSEKARERENKFRFRIEHRGRRRRERSSHCTHRELFGRCSSNVDARRGGHDVILRILCACVKRLLFSKVLVLVLMNIVFSLLEVKGQRSRCFWTTVGLKFSLVRVTCSIIYNLSFLAYRFRPGIFSIFLRYLYIRL